LKQIKGLDTLRAFAVIFVIIDHWGVPFSTKSIIPVFIKKYLIPDGQFGVDLFFVLSGFLITTILLHARSENKEENKLFIIKNFIVRRALRIFPIYYLMIIFLLFIHYPKLQEHVWYYLTYTSNILFFRKAEWGAIPHTWSLAVEEQFYLVWPWAILFIKKKHLKYIFIFSIIIGIASSYILSVILHKVNQPVLVYNCIGCFGLGGYYAYARMDESRQKKFTKWFFPFFIIALVIYLHWRYVYDQFWGHTNFIFRMIDGTIALQIIIAVINNKSEILRKYVLENRVLNHIGKISYGIYLFHYVLQPIYDGYIGRLMGKHANLPSIISNFYFSYCIKFLLLILICSLSYYLIEKPLLGLKRKFEYKPS
jgi:peptidoglycan/LPS O-acetylase OafA/YrhL